MLIVTIVALVLAASLGWFAYHLVQEEHRRSEARVALLTAALDVEPGDSFGAAAVPAAYRRPSPPATAAQRPPLRSVESRPAIAERPDLPSIVMLEGDSRDMGRFASEHGASGDSHRRDLGTPDLVESAPLHTVAPERTSGGTASTAARDRELFAAAPVAPREGGRGVMAIAALLLVGALALGALFFGSFGAGGRAAASATPAAVATPPRGGMPLDLVSLSHQLQGRTLVVRGLVRNPVAGSGRSGLVAHVVLLDQAGGVLGSGQAPLRAGALEPGEDVEFSVQLPSHKDVRRYRVTFRGAEGGLVPHADRRSPPQGR